MCLPVKVASEILQACLPPQSAFTYRLNRILSDMFSVYAIEALNPQYDRRRTQKDAIHVLHLKP